MEYSLAVMVNRRTDVSSRSHWSRDGKEAQRAESHAMKEDI